jgi:hypothetical protein
MKNLLEQLQTLQTIKLDSQVQARQRAEVLSSISSTANQQSYWKYFLSHPMVLKPLAYVAALLLLLVGGSAYTMSATWQSLPGGTFYPVKLQIEKLQVTLTADQVAKTKKQIAYTDRRFSEFADLSDSTDSAVNKQEQVAQVVRHFNDSLRDIKSSLDNVKADNGQAVDIAQLVNEKTQEYKEQLAGHYEDLPSTVKLVLEQAVENVKYQSLELLVANYQLAGSQISKETLVSQLQEKLIILGEGVSSMSGEKQTEALVMLSDIQKLLDKEEFTEVVVGINAYEEWLTQPVVVPVDTTGEVLGATEETVGGTSSTTISSTPAVIK